MDMGFSSEISSSFVKFEHVTSSCVMVNNSRCFPVKAPRIPTVESSISFAYHASSQKVKCCQYSCVFYMNSNSILIWQTLHSVSDSINSLRSQTNTRSYVDWDNSFPLRSLMSIKTGKRWQNLTSLLRFRLRHCSSTLSKFLTLCVSWTQRRTI